MSTVTMAIILVCNVNYYKFKTPDINENLAFVKCFKDMKQCYEWNGSVKQCSRMLKRLK